MPQQQTPDISMNNLARVPSIAGRRPTIRRAGGAQGVWRLAREYLWVGLGGNARSWKISAIRHPASGKDQELED